MSKILSKTIDDEVQKALEWSIVDLDIWFNNFINNVAQHNADRICELALKDKADTILTAQDKLDLREYLTNQGIVLYAVADLPINIKREIVKRANIPSVAERNAEAEKNL